KTMVEKASGPLDEVKAACYLLQERAVADLILSFYEQMLDQWDVTKDKEHEFINKMIVYFEGRLLRNPRLIWWWMADAGGLETSYEDPTRDRWRKNVLEPSQATTARWQDADGPFKPGNKAGLSASANS